MENAALRYQANIIGFAIVCVCVSMYLWFLRKPTRGYRGIELVLMDSTRLIQFDMKEGSQRSAAVHTQSFPPTRTHF